MPTIFTRIIDGELPGDLVWSDERCAAFLSINPLGPGHTLVVPRQEVDHWIDADAELLAHLTAVAHAVGAALQEVFAPPRVGLIIAGFEVPHLHVHVFPADGLGAFDFANAATSVDADEQAAHREALRATLRAAGHGASVPD
ncbi:HIT family protein [Pseudonocardia sp. CA-107938]|uniref:HIT family protein n=1 Tax=Pseudonocardia sp. CA-107938 TaxID=3240021 RepID=UPI003D918C22